MLLWLLLGLALAGEGTLIVHVFGANELTKANAVVELTDSEGRTVLLTCDRYGYLNHPLAEGTYTINTEGFDPVEITVEAGLQSEVLFSATKQIELDVPEEPEDTSSETVPLATLRGVIVDLDNAPISGAIVIVRGRSEEAVSDANGQFSLALPIGTQDLVVMKQGFTERRFNQVAITEDASELIVLLSPQGFQLSDFVVSAPRLSGTSATVLSERKEASSVSDVLGAEQMSRAGDSDAAAALKRVTGLTVVGGKYVYVRGLGERYSASLLNGSTLPSPEPERRVVPLDLFPTTLLDSITIQKTFSPDRPGEFGGGMVALKTRGIPEEPLLRIGVSGNYVDGSTFLTGLSGHQQSLDWTGFGTSGRNLPEAVQQASDENPLEETDMFGSRGYPTADLERFGELMPNRWGLQNQKVYPNAGLDIAYGRGLDIGAVDYGFLVAGLWKHGWDLEQFDRKYYVIGADNQLEDSHSYTFTELTENIRLSLAMMNKVEWSNHQIQSTTLLNRSTSYSTRTYEGYNRDVATNIRVTRINWRERALFFQQLTGDHLLHEEKEWSTTWKYAFSRAQRNEPDRREYRYDLEAGTTDWYLSNRPEGNSIFYSNLLDRNHDGTVQLRKKFNIGNTDRKSEFKTGAGAVVRRRSVDTRRFKYMHKGPLSNDEQVLIQPPEDIFVPENIGTDGFQFEEVTRETDNYSASQRIINSYAMVDTKLAKRWSVLSGVRMESSDQNVQTFELFNPNQNPVNANLKTTDFLPALTASADIGKRQAPDSMKLRLGYGRTVSRPDFRELSPATFNDVTGGRQVYGNPDLERAIIDNVDARWEWYPSAGETVSLGAFYKYFEQPIESIIVVSAQPSVTYQNADSAQNVGIEVDFRKSFRFLGPTFEELYLAGNASWINSTVTLSDNAGIQTSDQRPLQGQSPYIYNVQMGYDHPDGIWGLYALYNVFGPRITEVGALGAPDYFEQPVHRLDTVGYFANGFLQIGWKVQNILDWPSVVVTGGEPVEEVYDGRRVSLSLRYRR